MSAPQPLVPEQPLRFGEMLVATFRYLRRNPAATLGVGALLGTVTSTVTGVVMNGMVFGNGRGDALQRLLAGESQTSTQVKAAMAQIGDVAPYLALAGVVGAIVQFAAMGVMTLGMVRAMRGEHVRPSQLWREVPWGRIIGINALVFVGMVVVVALPVGLAIILGGSAAIAALVAAGFLAFLVAVISTMAVPAALMDDLGIRASLKRAVGVTRGAIVRTSWLVFASLVFWDAVGSLLGSPVGSVVGALAGGAASSSGQALTSLVAGIVTAAVTLPAGSAMAVLIYDDRKRRMRPTSA